MAKSIMQTGKYCYNCGIETGLHLHHIYYGTGKRKISDKTVYLLAVLALPTMLCMMAVALGTFV